MKKTITLSLVAIIIVSIFVVFKNGDLIEIRDPKANDVAPADVKIENWSTYTNSQYGLEFLYPSEFTVKENMNYYPASISFDSLLVKLGSDFELKIYNTEQSKNITSLDTIPRLTKSDLTSEILSTDNITNANSVPVQIVKGVQYSIKDGKVDKRLAGNRVSIIFMKGQNAYALNWDCWSNIACFNDEIIKKLADSIAFNK
jgi:hypothetical protein